MSYTYTETGKALTETQDGCTMPADYSFATVNDYVHGVDVNYEDLQYLCLGMASYIDRLHKSPWIDPNNKAQKQFLPHIGEKCFFAHAGKTYYGHHTGGTFLAGAGVTARRFCTWECVWMALPTAPNVK